MTSYKFDGHDDHVSDVDDDIEYTEGIVDTKDDDGADDDNNDDDLFNIPVMTTTTMMMTICSIFL